MGEYSSATSRPADGGLYPLEEEGTYGKVPKKEYVGKWTGPEPYVRREKKPKIYSSYSISDKCELHSLVLDKYSRGCKVHSSSSSRVARSVSSSSEENVNKTETIDSIDSGSSLPPSYKVEDLDMLSKLKLVRELEEDTRDALKDENAGHDSELDLKKGKDKESRIETTMIKRKDSNASYMV